MGKGKIKIARIEDRRKRRACFSKRCAGLFKKASELKTLSRSDVAVVVFDCDDKPYVFGSPSGAKNVFRRFLTKVGDSPPAADEHMSPDSAISNLVLQLEDEEGYVVTEEKKTQLGEIGERVEIEDMDDLNELEELQKRLNERRGVLLAQGKHQQSSPSEPAMFDQVNNFYCGQEMLGLVCDDAATVFCNADNPMQAMVAVSKPSVSFTSEFVDSSFFDGLPDYFS